MAKKKKNQNYKSQSTSIDSDWLDVNCWCGMVDVEKSAAASEERKDEMQKDREKFTETVVSEAMLIVTSSVKRMMSENEQNLLAQYKLNADGTHRLPLKNIRSIFAPGLQVINDCDERKWSMRWLHLPEPIPQEEIEVEGNVGNNSYCMDEVAIWQDKSSGNIRIYLRSAIRTDDADYSKLTKGEDIHPFFISGMMYFAWAVKNLSKWFENAIVDALYGHPLDGYAYAWKNQMLNGKSWSEIRTYAGMRKLLIENGKRLPILYICSELHQSLREQDIFHKMSDKLLGMVSVQNIRNAKIPNWEEMDFRLFLGDDNGRDVVIKFDKICSDISARIKEEKQEEEQNSEGYAETVACAISALIIRNVISKQARAFHRWIQKEINDVMSPRKAIAAYSERTPIADAARIAEVKNLTEENKKLTMQLEAARTEQRRVRRNLSDTSAAANRARKTEAAVKKLQEENAALQQQVQEISDQNHTLTALKTAKETVEVLQASVTAANKKLAAEKAQYMEQSNAAKRTIAELQASNKMLRESQKNRESVQNELRKARKEIESLQYKLELLHELNAKPTQMSDVAQWVQATLGDRLMLSTRAIGMLEEEKNGEISVTTLCDALLYLAYEYRGIVLGELSVQEAADRCAIKYQRAFSVSNTGSITQSDRQAMTYSCYFQIDGKQSLRSMDKHLKYGVANKNLIRIYFTFDKTTKKIMIGALPRHLPITNAGRV